MEESKRIRTREQLKEYLDVELKDLRITNPQQFIAYVFQISERAIIGKYIRLLRRTEYHLNAGHKLRGLFMNARLSRMMMRTGMHIGPNICGKGLQIAHVEPCGFTGGTVVGENCRLHAVSFTMADGKGNAPVIGNNVIIGMGAMLIGGVTIADDISIGAGAVVTKDFLEPGITIAGVPAKKLKDTRDRF